MRNYKAKDKNAMKPKLLAFLLAIVLLFSACTAKKNDDTQGGENDGSIVATDGHVDADDNGNCDDCGITVVINFDFYAINDMHGKFADSDSMIGVDELTTFIKNSQNRDKNAVFLSSGDMWQGSSESNLTKGLIITEWMSELGFASMTLGNHEFDWGEEYIEANLALAEFPFLAINIYERDTNERVDYAKPSVVVEKSGLQIGIIGAIGDCYSSISADKVEDIYFKTGSELTALVKAEAQRLKSEEGADLIVYSIHGDHSSYDIELSNGYVDVVFEGHTHRNYVNKDDYGVYHVQNGADNDGISHVDVDINFANGKTKVNAAEVIKNSRYSGLLDDPLVSELLQKYDEKISVSQKVLGTNKQRRSGDELRQLCAKLYYEVGIEKWGEKYDIALGGGYTSIRSPKYLGAGEVKYSHVQTLFPFDNTIVLCSIKGRELRSRFFESSNSDYFIAYGDYGEGIKDRIDDNATYYVITDTYNSSYAPNKLTVVDTYAPDVFARDLIANYIESGGLSS